MDRVPERGKGSVPVKHEQAVGPLVGACRNRRCMHTTNALNDQHMKLASQSSREQQNSKGKTFKHVLLPKQHGYTRQQDDGTCWPVAVADVHLLTDNCYTCSIITIFALRTDI